MAPFVRTARRFSPKYTATGPRSEVTGVLPVLRPEALQRKTRSCPVPHPTVLAPDTGSPQSARTRYLGVAAGAALVHFAESTSTPPDCVRARNRGARCVNRARRVLRGERHKAAMPVQQGHSAERPSDGDCCDGYGAEASSLPTQVRPGVRVNGAVCRAKIGYRARMT